MSVKEYLKQAFTIDKLIRAKEKRIRDLRDRQESLGSAMSIVNVQTTPNKDRATDITVDLLDLIAECELDIKKLPDTQREIKRLIDTVKRDDLRLILYERYINLKYWEDIAEDNNYHRDTVYKKHGKALKELEKVSTEFYSLDMI